MSKALMYGLGGTVAAAAIASVAVFVWSPPVSEPVLVGPATVAVPAPTSTSAPTPRAESAPRLASVTSRTPDARQDLPAPGLPIPGRVATRSVAQPIPRVTPAGQAPQRVEITGDAAPGAAPATGGAVATAQPSSQGPAATTSTTSATPTGTSSPAATASQTASVPSGTTQDSAPAAAPGQPGAGQPVPTLVITATGSDGGGTTGGANAPTVADFQAELRKRAAQGWEK